MHYFSVDYNSFDKSSILNIRKYLFAKNNIQKRIGLLDTQMLIGLLSVCTIIRSRIGLI